jgi:hypothetical protein
MRRFLPLTVLALPLVLTFCRDKNFVNVVPIANGSVTINDDCDSVTFNAGLGAGNCIKAGTTTLASYNSQLAATGAVAGWNFTPTSLTITSGGTVSAFNAGGQEHTFTAVAAFGGGSVIGNNIGVGTSVEAPECVNASLIAPGATFTTIALNAVAVVHYQCCIHPWEHTDVTVVNR